MEVVGAADGGRAQARVWVACTSHLGERGGWGRALDGQALLTALVSPRIFAVCAAVSST